MTLRELEIHTAKLEAEWIAANKAGKGLATAILNTRLQIAYLELNYAYEQGKKGV